MTDLPLEPVDPQWAADRAQEFAEGRRPNGQRTTKGLKSSSLREFEPDRAVLDIYCRGRHVARVLAPRAEVALLPGVVLQMACEARTTEGGGTALWLHDAHLGESIAVAVCRCGSRHTFAVNRLVTVARGQTPGRPKRVALLTLVSPPKTT